MDWILMLKKIFLGIVQGISEILPISSSGHTLIFSNILNIDTNGLQLLIFLHFGSLVAMIIYYWKDIWNIIVSLCRYLFKKDRTEDTRFYCRLFIYMVIATIPAGIIGLLLSNIIDEYLSNLYFVFSFLIITGIILLINRKLKGEKTLKEMKPLDALGIGCFQCIGVLPGISRSGSTIFGGKVMKLNNEDAAHFSFLLFLPITAGSFLVEVITGFDEIMAYQTFDLISDIIAVIVAGIFTFLSVKYLFKIIKKGKLHYFAFYCFLVGIVGIITCLSIRYGF